MNSSTTVAMLYTPPIIQKEIRLSLRLFFKSCIERGNRIKPNNPSPTPGQLDSRTELVVLVKDFGDRNVNSWIPDVASALFIRYEIEVTDPLTGGKGWVYLYRSNTLTLDPDLTDYITYFASDTGNPGQDRIQTPYYENSFDTAGFPKEWIIFVSAGGDGTNFLDGTRLRVATSFANISETNITANTVEVIEGLIRAIRRVLGTLTIPIPIIPDIVIAFNLPPSFYYPYRLL